MSFLSRLATRFYRNSWVGVFIILLVLCSNFRYSFINTDPGGDSTLLSLPETFGWGFFIPLLLAFVPIGTECCAVALSVFSCSLPRYFFSGSKFSSPATKRFLRIASRLIFWRRILVKPQSLWQESAS